MIYACKGFRCCMLPLQQLYDSLLPKSLNKTLTTVFDLQAFSGMRIEENKGFRCLTPLLMKCKLSVQPNDYTARFGRFNIMLGTDVGFPQPSSNSSSSLAPASCFWDSSSMAVNGSGGSKRRWKRL